MAESGSEEEESSDEEKIMPGDPHEKEKLLARREELVALLRSVRQSLESNDHPVIEDDPLKGSDEKGSGLWSMRHGRFTDRGKEGCRKMFEKFAVVIDAEGRRLDQGSGSIEDGKNDAPGELVAYDAADTMLEPKQTMNYFAFRGYLHAVGRPFELEPHVIGKQETWRCYMFDLFGLEADGGLNASHFEAYRTYIEARFPLELDLLTAGINVLPDKLVEWKLINTAFDKLASENITEEELYALRRDGIDYIPKVPAPQVQLLAYDAGELLTQAHCEWLELMHFNHNAMAAEVRRVYNERNKFAWHQTSAVKCDDRTAFYRDSSAAWWFSNRPRQALREMEEHLLRFKMRCIRGARNFMHLFDVIFGRLHSLTERGLIMSAIFNRIKQDTGRYTSKVELGDADAEEAEGFTANVTYSSVSNAAKSFSAMGLPPGIGSVALIDLLVRDQAPRPVVAECIQKINKLLGAHFDKELNRLNNYHSYKVFAHQHETDLVPVVRIAIMLKPESSLDFKLRQLNLGVKVSEVLIDLNISMHISHPITEILEAKKFVVNDMLSGGVNGSLVVGRKILAKVIEEFLYMDEENSKRYAVENEERRSLFDTAFQRTKDAVLRKFTGEQRERKAASVKEMTVTGYEAGRKDRTTAEMTFYERAAKFTRSAAWTCLGMLRSAKTTTLELRWETVSELLFSNIWTRSRLPTWLVRDLVETPGAPARAWKKVAASLKTHIAKHWRRITNHEKLQVMWVEQAARDAADAANRLSKKERARLAFLEEKRQLAAKLSALGIDVDEDLGGEESNHDRPVEYARECKNKQIRNERNILECYRASWRALCSVHGLQVQSGANRITVGFQGLDVFELLPEPPENPACVIPKSEEEKREEEELMKRSTKAREGKSGGND